MDDDISAFSTREDLEHAWTANGWPEDLLQTALELRIPRRQVQWWLAQAERGLERARQ